MNVHVATNRRLRIAVIGSGISGLSASWLLGADHDVVLYEQDAEIGGHAYTIDTQAGPVDMGFMVYNEKTYPNLTAFFDHLEVETRQTDMSFSASLDDGQYEYGSSLAALFAQPYSIVSRRHWAMLKDIARFYTLEKRQGLAGETIGALLDRRGYGQAFRDDHFYPMAASIWSVPTTAIADSPARAMIDFLVNHNLMNFTRRPRWRTVCGGSRSYVSRLLQSRPITVRNANRVEKVTRLPAFATVSTIDGSSQPFDHVVFASHADQALAMLATPTNAERQILGRFKYENNFAVLHSDPSLMPKRRRVWSSWNFVGSQRVLASETQTTYWMNRLQNLHSHPDFFVTINPPPMHLHGTVATRAFRHPRFDLEAYEAKAKLWTLQGQQRTWFCGSYFGAGFHEDGLQSGLAVAELIGGRQRPWTVDGDADRIGYAGLDRLRSSPNQSATFEGAHP